jgi:hypothetical protein
MAKKGFRGFRGVVPMTIGMLAVFAGLVGPAQAFTPESPEVRELLDKGFEYLNTSGNSRLGGKALVGLAFHFDGADKNHPKIVEAIEACKLAADFDATKIGEDIYSTGLAIIFLCEIDSSKYRVEIERLVESLVIRQKKCGGWGYPHGDHSLSGDTSMTQYGVLSLWKASKKNIIEMPRESIESVCNWLIRTQDPSGGWGYQGVDPGEENYERVPQSNVRDSLTAAALGSTIICSELLNFTAPMEMEEDLSLPPTLSLVLTDEKGEAKVIAEGVSGRRLANAIKDGHGWFAKNYRIDPDQWTYYYMYAFERYQSFRESAMGNSPREPRWYNDGVVYLREQQKEDGSWSWQGQNTSCDTAFAILFLLRSTKKSIQATIQDTGDGMLVGGQDLPSDIRNLRIRNDRIMGKPKDGAPDELLAILEDPEHPDFEYTVDFPADFEWSDEPEERARQLARMRRLVRVESYEARSVAVRMLARSRDLDSVPVLIYAMATDPDRGVTLEARNGLRFISRKFSGFDLSDEYTDAEKLGAVDSWKKWYRSIRPGAEFMN